MLCGSHDLRLGLRRWRHRPGFAFTAIATLALGIGAATAIFSVVDAVLLRPLPWIDPDRLVAIHAVFPERRQNPGAALTWNRGTVSLRRVGCAPQGIRVCGCRRLAATTARHDTRGSADGASADDGRLVAVPADARRSPGARPVFQRRRRQRQLGQYPYSVRGLAAALRRPCGHHRSAARLGSASSGDNQSKTVVGVLEPGFGFDGDTSPEVLFPVGIGAQAGRRYIRRFPPSGRTFGA